MSSPARLRLSALAVLTLATHAASAQDTTRAPDSTRAPVTIVPVVVTSTRIERRLEDEPLRVEVLSGEDVAEKTEMRPGDLRTLFQEMSGVRVQPVSASLGAASVRVQGLRGRYTLLLNDGLPLYGTYGGSFSLLQQPPLDLRQAEVIKGAASALYGPSALGGVVNLVSRRPPDTSQVVANETSRQGTDALGFLARRLSRTTGVTLLAGAHLQHAMDPDHDAWSDVAGFRRAELRPRFFYGRPGLSAMFTTGALAEDRAGGPSDAAGGIGADSLSTRHVDVGGTTRWRMSPAWTLATRTAANVQRRRRLFAGNLERERQHSLFAEVTATGLTLRGTLVGGLSWQREGYANTDVSRFDEAISTPAAFVQHTWVPASWIATSVNGRCDASSRYGTICTPRASLLAKPSDALSVRGSVGNGWFAPMPLNEETEPIGLSRVRMPAPLAAERARTASLDVTATRGPLQVNATLYQSRVARPVGLRPLAGDTTGVAELVNAAGAMRIHGGELFAVYAAEPVIATAYWATTRSRELSPESGRMREVTYTPRQEAGLDVALEDDESGAYIAGEVFYTGVQALEDDPYLRFSHPYTTVGILGAMRVGPSTVFVNLENVTGVRQSRYEPILRPLGARPGPGGMRAVMPWAPLEGRAVNVGVRYAL